MDRVGEPCRRPDREMRLPVNNSNVKIPARLGEIIEDFQICEGREKLELLLEFSEKMPALPEWLEGQHDQMDKVEECMTPVFVHAEQQDNRMSFYFDVPPESPTIRGYAALLSEGLAGATPEEILQVPGDFYREMGLHQVLTNQRLQGISAILAHMKQLAVKQIDE
jgi:cysteine desulfuration protein SufE